MSEITIYIPTGEIVRWVDCNESAFNLQLVDDEAFIKGRVSNETFYIDIFNKLPVAKSIKPSVFHVFNYNLKNWELDENLAWETIKKQRAEKLSNTDWVVVKAQETGTTVPEVWLNYRQALRDITLQPDLLKIVWPVAP